MRTSDRWLLLALISLVLSACTTGSLKPQPAGLSYCPLPGTIGRDKVPHPTRGFNVSFQYYLPPCYESSKSSHFPVIYLISFAYDYRLDDTADTPMSVADRLIRAGDMPPAILVAPDDTVGFGYHAALALDLVPYVDHKYNTIPERKYRGVAGISHGGAIAARMAIQFPEEFGSLGVLSGGIATGETDTFEGWIASAPSDSRPRIRIDLGDQDIGILPLTQNLTKVLDHNNISYTLNMGHGGHSDFFWSPLMEPYLLWFAAAWK